MAGSRTWNRLVGLLTWAKVIRSKQAAGVRGQAQTTAFGVTDDYARVQPYGFISRPQEGARAVVASIGSDAAGRVVILIDDPRYTITLEAGEVAVVDDLGQKVHFKRDGIVIEAPSIKLGASASLAAARATDPVAAAASMAAWITAVSSATSVPAPTDFGVITSGSAKTRIQ